MVVACLCLAAAGLSWVWTGQGRRFTVLPHSPTASNLLTVTITENDQGERCVELVPSAAKPLPGPLSFKYNCIGISGTYGESAQIHYNCINFADID